MLIRNLNEADAEAYWKLRLEALELEPYAFGKSAEEHRSTTPETVALRIREMPSHDFYLGAFDNGNLIGTATFVRETGLKERHKGHIYGFYVTASHRGRGIGRALMAGVIERVRKDSSVEQILLSVAARQHAAARLYGAFGFEIYGTEPRALKIGSQYIDEQQMVLRLR